MLVTVVLQGMPIKQAVMLWTKLSRTGKSIDEQVNAPCIIQASACILSGSPTQDVHEPQHDGLATLLHSQREAGLQLHGLVEPGTSLLLALCHAREGAPEGASSQVHAGVLFTPQRVLMQHMGLQRGCWCDLGHSADSVLVPLRHDQMLSPPACQNTDGKGEGLGL